ncbi:hypothetical protein HZS_4369 [Henneguya salminicola]|nr:hypothetical protein HZS_4369 [Henneguya salminicola]
MLYFCLTFLLCLFIFCLLLYLYDNKRGNRFSYQKEGTVVSHKLQNVHFKVYLLALLVEWLQGPYLFRLYADYCLFDEKYIAILYIIGVIVAPLVMPFIPILIEFLSPLGTTLLFTMFSFIALITKLSTSFKIHIISRILATISITNMLICIDEWYAKEIAKARFVSSDNPEKRRTTKIWGNLLELSVSGMAIISGIIADCAAHWLYFGFAAPYIFAIVPLFFLVYFLIRHKLSNSTTGFTSRTIDTLDIDILVNEECICGTTIYHKRRVGCYLRGIKDTLQSIYIHKRFALLFSSVLQSLIDCTIYVYTLSWTPILEYSIAHSTNDDFIYLPLGIIFSCFLASIMIGNVMFRILSSYSVLPTKILIVVSCNIMLLDFFLCNYSPLHQLIHPKLCLATLICLQISYGLYTPSIQWLREHSIPVDIANSKFRIHVL